MALLFADITKRWGFMEGSQNQRSPADIMVSANEDDEVDEVTNISRSNSKAKRMREAQDEGMKEMRSPKIAKNDHSQRLLPQFSNTPDDGKRINVPTYSHNTQRPDKRPTGKVGRSQHKLRNTLDHPLSGSRNSNRYSISETLQAKPRIARNIGGNFRTPEHFVQDDYRGSSQGLPGVRTKKRKLMQGMRPMDSEIDPVDLTEDDSPIVSDTKRFEHKGKVLIVVPRSKSSKPSDEPFTHNAFHNVNRLVAPAPQKSRRRSREGGSQKSNQTSLDSEGLEEYLPIRNGTRGSPVVVPDDDPIHQAAGSQPTAKKRRINPSGPMLSIATSQNRQMTGQSALNSGIREEDHDNVAIMQVTQTPGARQARRDYKGEGRVPPPDFVLSRRQSPNVLGAQPDEEPRLNRTFKRDNHVHTPRPETGPSRRVMASSNRTGRVTPIDDSADEISGGLTERVSGSQAPLRQNGTPFAGRPDRSPSVLTPDRRKRSVMESPERYLASPNDALHEPESLRISSFYATSNVLRGGDIELLYDVETANMDLYFEGKPQIVPGQQCVVSLGEAEMRKILCNEHSNRVVLKGSSTKVSNGTICISFKDKVDVIGFLDRILLATNTKIDIEHEDYDRLNKLFANQAREISMMADKFKKQEEEKDQLRNRGQAHAGNPRYSTGETHFRGDRRNVHQQTHDLEEEIKYEDDSRDVRSSARSRMQGDFVEDFSTNDKSSPRLQSATGPILGFTRDALRRTTRNTQPAKLKTPPQPERWTQINQPKRWSQSVFYPAVGTKRVTVDFQDLERLDEGEFLNDNVINFALRQIEESMTSDQKDDVHFFNTFFYSALTTKNGKKAFNFDAVSRWTKSKDIFNIPFIVVPINIDLHWFVAIICNLPNLARKIAGVDNSEAEERQGAIAQDTAQQPDGLVIKQLSDPETVTEGIDDLTLSDTGSKTHNSISGPREDDLVALADNENIAIEFSSQAVSAAKKTPKRRNAPPLRKYDLDSAVIITLDSLGSSRNLEVRNLKDYLSCEADSKRSMTVERDQLQGITAKGIPEQDNFCDCGVYLVGYVEQFAKDPRRFVNRILNREMDKGDFENFSPSKKRAEIRQELLQINAKQEGDRRAKMKLKVPKEDTSRNGTEANPSDGPSPGPNERGANPGSLNVDVDDLGMLAAKDDVLVDPGTAARPSVSEAVETDHNNELEITVPRSLQQTRPALKPSWTPLSRSIPDGQHFESASEAILPSADQHTLRQKSENHGTNDKGAEMGHEGETANDTAAAETPAETPLATLQSALKHDPLTRTSSSDSLHRVDQRALQSLEHSSDDDGEPEMLTSQKHMVGTESEKELCLEVPDSQEMMSARARQQTQYGD